MVCQCLSFPFTVSCGNRGGGGKEPFKRQAFKRKKMWLLLAIDEVQVLHHEGVEFHSQFHVEYPGRPSAVQRLWELGLIPSWCGFP